MTFPSHEAYIFLGPTASGKTARALAFAQDVAGEVINCDMPQCYTRLTIGTAKPSQEERDRVPHHLFDLFDEPHVHSAYAHRALVEEKLQELWKRGATPLIVGGSTFYLFSLFFKMPPLIKRDSSQIREKVLYENFTTGELWNKLFEYDPARAQVLYPQDRYRICRALDLYQQGYLPSSHMPLFDPLARFHVMHLDVSRDTLLANVMQRTCRMYATGLLEEVASLTEEWRSFVVGRNIIGYPETLDYLAGKSNQEESIGAIVKSTMNYAKKQRTFFKMLHKRVAEDVAWTFING